MNQNPPNYPGNQGQGAPNGSGWNYGYQNVNQQPPYPHLNEVREAAQHSLPGALRLSLEGTEAYVARRGEKLHPMTADTLAWLKAAAH